MRFIEANVSNRTDGVEQTARPGDVLIAPAATPHASATSARRRRDGRPRLLLCQSGSNRRGDVVLAQPRPPRR
jgi:hypothetical protein